MSERTRGALQSEPSARARRRLLPWRSRQDVLARIVRRVLDCAESSGLNRRVLTNASGLGEFDLSNSDSRIPISHLVALWQLIGKAASDPGLVVRWTDDLHVRDWGLLGYLLVNSGTLGDALHRFERYFRVVSASADARLDVSHHRTAALVLRNATAGLDLPYAVDYLLSSVVMSLRLITRVRVVPLTIDCACAQPSSTLSHREFYRCPMRFSRTESRIVLAVAEPDGERTPTRVASARSSRCGQAGLARGPSEKALGGPKNRCNGPHEKSAWGPLLARRLLTA